MTKKLVILFVKLIQDQVIIMMLIVKVKKSVIKEHIQIVMEIQNV